MRTTLAPSQVHRAQICSKVQAATSAELIFLHAPASFGKTTTLRAICAMIARDGEILFECTPKQGLATESIVRSGIAHVSDVRGTFGTLTTEENLNLGAMPRRDRCNIQQDIEMCDVLFPRLKDWRHQQAGTLSGGGQ